SINPLSVAAMRGLTTVHMRSGHTDAARSRVERALAERPKDPGVLALAADFYLAAKQPDKAEATLRQLVVVDPNALEGYAKLAQLYVQQKRLDAALKEFDTIASRQS